MDAATDLSQQLRLLPDTIRRDGLTDRLQTARERDAHVGSEPTNNDSPSASPTYRQLQQLPLTLVLLFLLLAKTTQSKRGP